MLQYLYLHWRIGATDLVNHVVIKNINQIVIASLYGYKAHPGSVLDRSLNYRTSNGDDAGPVYNGEPLPARRFRTVNERERIDRLHPQPHLGDATHRQFLLAACYNFYDTGLIFFCITYRNQILKR